MDNYGDLMIETNISCCDINNDNINIGEVYINDEFQHEFDNQIQELNNSNYESIKIYHLKRLEFITNNRNLQKITICSINTLVNISNIPKLKYLDIKLCNSITNISNLELLETLSIDDCENLQNISNLPNLKELILDNTNSITDISNFSDIIITRYIKRIKAIIFYFLVRRREFPSPHLQFITNQK